MKVISYLQTVPAKNTKPQKEQLLRDFVTGVCAAGDQGEVYSGQIGRASCRERV